MMAALERRPVETIIADSRRSLDKFSALITELADQIDQLEEANREQRNLQNNEQR